MTGTKPVEPSVAAKSAVSCRSPLLQGAEQSLKQEIPHRYLLKLSVFSSVSMSQCYWLLGPVLACRWWHHTAAVLLSWGWARLALARDAAVSSTCHARFPEGSQASLPPADTGVSSPHLRFPRSCCATSGLCLDLGGFK